MIWEGDPHDSDPISCHVTSYQLDWPSALGCSDGKEKAGGVPAKQMEELTGSPQGVGEQVRGAGASDNLSLPMEAVELGAEDKTHDSWESPTKEKGSSFAAALQ